MTPSPSVFVMTCLALLGAAVCGRADGTSEISPIASKVSNRLSDVVQVSSPAAVHLGGWLGNRIAVSEKNRLLTIEIEPMLAGFREKPGNHPWIGEHVGKWIHASTLAWANTGDPSLRAKLDLVVKELIAAQEPDGYLGTYAPEQRFGLYPGADWDVWSHKYCLIGLLTYYQYTGYEPALAAARRAADLLLRTFPAKKSILAAGTHMGMAATSVLEPIVLLYRLTWIQFNMSLLQLTGEAKFGDESERSYYNQLTAAQNPQGLVVVVED